MSILIQDDFITIKTIILDNDFIMGDHISVDSNSNVYDILQLDYDIIMSLNLIEKNIDDIIVEYTGGVNCFRKFLHNIFNKKEEKIKNDLLLLTFRENDILTIIKEFDFNIAIQVGNRIYFNFNYINSYGINIKTININNYGEILGIPISMRLINTQSPTMIDVEGGLFMRIGDPSDIDIHSDKTRKITNNKLLCVRNDNQLSYIPFCNENCDSNKIFKMMISTTSEEINMRKLSSVIIESTVEDKSDKSWQGYYLDEKMNIKICNENLVKIIALYISGNLKPDVIHYNPNAKPPPHIRQSNDIGIRDVGKDQIQKSYNFHPTVARITKVNESALPILNPDTGRRLLYFVNMLPDCWCRVIIIFNLNLPYNLKDLMMNEICRLPIKHYFFYKDELD